MRALALKQLRTVAMLAALGACAQPPAPQVEPARADSVTPGTIGVVVSDEQTGVVVTALGNDGAAAHSGVQVGDVVLSCNGERVSTSRHFNRLVVGTPPGTRLRLELLREGTVRTLEVPVEQLDLAPRG
jgi:S1-C subfamily serine protease